VNLIKLIFLLPLQEDYPMLNKRLFFAKNFTKDTKANQEHYRRTDPARGATMML